MKKTFELLKQEFESSTTRTAQYLDFHRTFKREFTKFLLEQECTKVEVFKPNHFDISGFFTSKNNQIWYFSIEDLRWSKNYLLFRKAESYTDYKGQNNGDISLTLGYETFKEQLISFIQ